MFITHPFPISNVVFLWPNLCQVSFLTILTTVLWLEINWYLSIITHKIGIRILGTFRNVPKTSMPIHEWLYRDINWFPMVEHVASGFWLVWPVCDFRCMSNLSFTRVGSQAIRSSWIAICKWCRMQMYNSYFSFSWQIELFCVREIRIGITSFDFHRENSFVLMLWQWVWLFTWAICQIQ